MIKTRVAGDDLESRPTARSASMRTEHTVGVIAVLSMMLMAPTCGGGSDGGGGHAAEPPEGGSTGGWGGTSPGPAGALEAESGFDKSRIEEFAGDAGAPAAVAGLCPGKERLTGSLVSVVGGANAFGSATAAREILRSLDRSPLPRDIRPQDFVNYYAPELPATDGELPAIHVQLAESGAGAYFDLMVALKAPAVERQPLVLTLLVDNTQSLGDLGLERARAVLRNLASKLEPGDQAVWLTAADNPDDLPPFEPGAELEDAIDALGLEPERETADLLSVAYERARAQAVTGAWNRVVLISDGEGPPELVWEAALAPDSAREIRTVAIGVGPGAPNGHRLLRAASRKGQGAYVHVDSETEAGKLDLASLFGVAFDSIQTTLRVPWYFELDRPFPGDITTQPSSIEPQYLAPGGSMIFLFRLKACDARAPYQESGEIEVELTQNGTLLGSPQGFVPLELLSDQTRPAELGKAFLALGYAEALRSLDGARLRRIHELTSALPEDPELAEISELISKHPAFETETSP
jgi:hypothetical protein